MMRRGRWSRKNVKGIFEEGVNAKAAKVKTK